MAAATAVLLASCAYSRTEPYVLVDDQRDLVMGSVDDPAAEGMVTCLSRGGVGAIAIPSGDDGSSAAGVVPPVGQPSVR
jgi:hypothetical protein